MRRWIVAGLVLGLALPVRAQTVLRVVPQSDVTVLDPMFGTAWITLVQSAMIYESLFAWDSNLQPKPQMVESFAQAEDGLSWRFTLRPGLRFHDGSPVAVADVIASTRRWMAIDPVGVRLAEAIAELREADPRTLEMVLRKPFPNMPTALAAMPARMPAIMRARDALDAAGAPVPGQVNTAIGSGPFRYVANERVAGHISVYARNPDYVPRAEPPDGLAGGRVVKVDRVEWHVIPDPATAAAALQAGEVDLMDRLVLDTVEVLSKQPRVKVVPSQVGQSMLRPNATMPPFNNPKARLALAYIVDQSDEMAAGWGDSRYWQTCNSYFICGSPYGTEAGAQGLKQDFARAKELLKEAGYKGEKLTFVATKEIATLGQMSEVAYDALTRAGVNVEMLWGDWGTTGQRLRKRDGWHLFLTGAPGPIQYDPLTNVATDMSCAGRNFVGWPCDEEAERLRTAFLEAAPDQRLAALDRLHRRLVEVQPYRVLGQYQTMSALRDNVDGLLPSPILVYWNISKR